MDETMQLCSGCYRSIDEIIDWAIMSAGEKQRVIDKVAIRRESFDSP